jgi:hypothetical protein
MVESPGVEEAFEVEEYPVLRHELRQFVGAGVREINRGEGRSADPSWPRAWQARRPQPFPRTR